MKRVYDRLNRLTDLYQDPTGLNLRTEHRYDKNGNEEVLIDAKGQRIDTGYDELDRPNTRSYTFASGVSERPWRHTTLVDYGYDENGNVKQVDETAAVGGSTGTLRTVRVWSDLDRMESETTDLADGGGSKTVAFGYYKNGLRQTVSADGSTTSYVYDGQNRLKTATTSDGGSTEYTYFGDGLTETIAYPNGMVATHVYDDADRLSR